MMITLIAGIGLLVFILILIAIPQLGALPFVGGFFQLFMGWLNVMVFAGVFLIVFTYVKPMSKGIMFGALAGAIITIILTFGGLV